MSDTTAFIILISILINLTTILVFGFFFAAKLRQLNLTLDERFGFRSEQDRQLQFQQQLEQQTQSMHECVQKELTTLRENFYQNQLKAQQALHESMTSFHHQNLEGFENSVHRLRLQLIETLSDVQKGVKQTLSETQTTLSHQFERLNQTTESRLIAMGEKVEERLSKGFEKTSQTFADVVKRLALIDDAQKKIHDLSSNVVSLQQILQDKRSRGVFGEIQLKHLLENTLPAEAFALQFTLSNQARVDCMLFLPEPTGHLAIDAKFPLNSFQVFTDYTLPDSERKQAQQQFKQDIKKHIQDIHQKYIIPGETSDGALMFIPAEAVFAEIHAHFPELVEYSHQMRVWMTSPTTMMAILTTASAVLKDSATRKQVHVIQKHLKDLAKDFGRFEKRMDNLAKHLHQANEDVDQVHTTARKISSRFAKIERVELDEHALPLSEEPLDSLEQ